MADGVADVDCPVVRALLSYELCEVVASGWCAVGSSEVIPALIRVGLGVRNRFMIPNATSTEGVGLVLRTSCVWDGLLQLTNTPYLGGGGSLSLATVGESM